MHKPESFLENDTLKTLWDFEIPMDHRILVRKPDLVLINKKRGALSFSEFCCFCGSQRENKKSEKIHKYLDLARKLKKTNQWNMQVTVIPIVVGVPWPANERKQIGLHFALEK